MIAYLFAAVRLLPVLDMISDVWTLETYIKNAWIWSSCIASAVLYMNWRFATIYAAIHVKPTFSKVLMIYIPFAVLPCWASVMASDGDYFDNVRVHPDSSSHVHDKAASATLYRAQAAQWFVLNMINSTWQKNPSPMREMRNCTLRLLALAKYPFAVIILEIKLFVLSFLLGPVFVSRASLTLARECLRPEHAANANSEEHRHNLYNQVLTFIEALFESTPQLILQTYIFVYYLNKNRSEHRVPLHVFGLSAACSIAGILNAIVTFVRNSNAILSVLAPAIRVQSLSQSVEVSSTSSVSLSA